jgi:hypothetical protein
MARPPADVGVVVAVGNLAVGKILRVSSVYYDGEGMRGREVCVDFGLFT